MKLRQSMRNEILRIARTHHNSAFISTRRLSVFYGVPESEVRRELTRLADERLIQVSGWDGRQMRPYAQGGDSEEFVNSQSEQVHVAPVR